MKNRILTAVVAAAFVVYSLYKGEWNSNFVIGINAGLWGYLLIASTLGRWLSNKKSQQ